MSIFKNWQPTLAGIIAGITGGSVAQWQKPDGSIHWQAVLLAVALAALGALAKQHNVTGGTKPQTIEAVDRSHGPNALPVEK